MADNATGTAQSTGTIREAASAFEQLLTLEDGDNQGVEAKPEEETEVESEGESDEVVEEIAAEDEQSDEAAEEDEKPQDQLFTVRVDGTDQQVPLSELLAGYSRTKDYTQKTQALAVQRKELDQVHALTRQERAEYAELLPKLRNVLEAGLKEPDWESLRAQDPARAAVEYDRFQERKAKAAALKAEEERVRAKEAEEMEAERNQILIHEQEALLKRPELSHWSDEAKAGADAKLIVATLKDAGYADEELKIYDHRAMVLAWKAAQYDQLTKKRGVAQQSIRQKVSTAPVSKPGNGNRQAPSAVRKASDRLAKSGSIKDAASFFETILN